MSCQKARRGELCALSWSKVDLDNGIVVLDSSVAQNSQKKWLKDTKTHQQRRLAIDPETVALLRDHKQECESRARLFGDRLAHEAFVFSLAPDNSEFLVPDSVSQRYRRRLLG